MKNSKYIFPVFITLIMLCMTSCKVELFDCLKEEGTIETRIVELETIYELDIEIPINIILTQGAEQHIEITAHSNVIDKLLDDSRVDKEKWSLELDGCADINEIEIAMTLETIKEITVEAVANIQTNGVFENIDDLKIQIEGVGDLKLELGSINSFDLDVDGVAEINISGNTSEQILDISGTAEINNLDFKSTTAEVDIAGTGNCEIWVEDNLEADLNGFGTLCIKGDPDTDIDTNGVFNIEDCN